MTGWSGPLGEALAALIDHRGKTPKKLGTDWVDDGVRVLSALHVKGGRLQAEPQRFVPRDVYDRWMPEKLQAGDVLLTSEAPLGEVAYLSESVEACLGQRLFGLRPKPEVLDSRYLFYLLQHSSLRSQLLQRSSGTTVAGIRQAELVRVALELPPLDHQQRVADALGSFDDLLENNRRRIEILEEMARLLYREWFVHFRFPGHEDVEVVDSELGPIPEGWEMARVEEIQADIRNATAAGPFGSKLGRKDYVDQGVPVIRGTNLAVGGGFLDSGFVYVSEQKAATLSSSMARPGDILVTQRGTLGQCGLIPDTANHSEYVISQSQMKLTCDADKIHPVIVHMQLALPEGVQQVLSMATGSGVPHINLGMFREMKMLVPSRHVQDPFVEATEPMFRLERNLRAQNRVLSEVRDLLLPRLVSGDLDVSELDLDGVLA